MASTLASEKRKADVVEDSSLVMDISHEQWLKNIDDNRTRRAQQHRFKRLKRICDDKDDEKPEPVVSKEPIVPHEEYESKEEYKSKEVETEEVSNEQKDSGSDKEMKRVEQIGASETFYMSIADVCKLGQWMVENGTFICIIPDSQFLRCGKKKTKTTYKLTELKMYTEKEADYVGAQGSVIRSEDSKVEIGESWKLNGDMLLVSTIEWIYNPKLGHNLPDLTPPAHEYAQVRSDFFADHVAHDLHETVIDANAIKDMVLCFDGPGRNIGSLRKAGVPDNRIILMERLRTSALFHRLSKLIRCSSIHTIWTGEDQRNSMNGFETYILHPEKMDKAIGHPCRIRWAYIDGCGDFATGLEKTIGLLEERGLTLLGLTRGKRNCFAPFPTSFGRIVKAWDQPKAICKFYQK